jgi:hypothetical protein
LPNSCQHLRALFDIKLGAWRRGRYQVYQEFYGEINGGGTRAGGRLKVEAVDETEGHVLKFDEISRFSHFPQEHTGAPNELNFLLSC